MPYVVEIEITKNDDAPWAWTCGQGPFDEQSLVSQMYSNAKIAPEEIVASSVETSMPRRWVLKATLSSKEVATKFILAGPVDGAYQDIASIYQPIHPETFEKVTGYWVDSAGNRVPGPA
jgi:hypothetical protein